MKKILKILSGLILVGIIAGLYVWFFVYNKPHRDYVNAEPDYKLTAVEFYNHYANDSDKNVDYLDKVIQFEGKPTDIEHSDSTVIIVFAFDSGMFGDEGIRCTMLPEFHETALSLKLNNTITLKGYCAGYNGTDIILENCSIIKN